MKEYLMLIPYKYSKDQGTELLTMLRSFYKYKSKDEEYRIVLLGGECPFLKGTEFENLEIIYGDDEQFTGCRGQQIRTMRDFFKAAMFFKSKYENFIWASDDYFCIKEFTHDDLALPKWINEHISGNANVPKEWWRYSKYKTGCMLRQMKLTDKNYTSHCFVEINFEKLLLLIQKYNLLNFPNDYVWEDIYFNIFKPEKEIFADEIRVGVWNKEKDKQKFKDALKNKNIKFGVYSEEGYSDFVESEVKKLIEKNG